MHHAWFGVKQAVLAAPNALARLMELLGSEHEVLRNEALLLLAGLARASPEIQKFAAYQGAFERLPAIIQCALGQHPCCA